MMCTPTSHGATGGKIPSFPTASASKSLRLEYGYSGHHTETDHVIRSGSLDCRRVAGYGLHSRESSSLDPDVRCGAYLGRKRRVQTSVALRPFAFTNLTTRVVTHLKLPIMHQGQPDCAHVASVRARTRGPGNTTHVCTVHRYYTQHKDTLRRFCKPSAGGSDRRAHMHMKNDGARSALRRPSLSSLVSRVVGPIY